MKVVDKYMLSFNDKISIRQLQILLMLEIFGVGVIILPKKVSQYANQDGWIIIILATLLAMFYAYIITSIAQMFPKQSFTEYSSKILSKPVGVILTFGFILKILINIAMELRFFGEIIKKTILPETPFYIICFVMLSIGGYAASKGFETRARIAEILILIVLLPIAIFSLSLKDIDFSNLLPMLQTPTNEYFKGAYFTVIAFTGIEFCLLVYPYMNNPKKVQRGVLEVIGYIGIFMLVITVITIAKFGPDNLKRQNWPVLEMMEMINLPGSFIERQDALIISFWIISVFAIVNAGLFFSSILLKDVIKRGKHSHYILVCLAIIFAISFIPNNVNDILNIMNAVFLTLGISYLFIIPFLLLIVAKIRRIK
jgi:spore germination protein